MQHIARSSDIIVGYRTLRPQDTSATGHFGPARDTSAPAPKTRFETLRHWCRSVLRHFGTKSLKNGTLRHQDNLDETLRHWCRSALSKSRDNSAPEQMGRDTSAPVPKCPKRLRHQSLRHFCTGAEVSRTLRHQIRERRNLANSKCRNSAET